MAVVNYSVPDVVKDEFNKAFAKQNKSQIIASLMQQAIEGQNIQQQRKQAITDLLKLRTRLPQVDATQLADVLKKNRS